MESLRNWANGLISKGYIAKIADLLTIYARLNERAV